MHARTYDYILPFHQIRAASNKVGDWGDAGHALVPIDDELSGRSRVDWGYGDHRGEARLRAAVAEYLAAARGVRCRPEQIVLT